MNQHTTAEELLEMVFCIMVHAEESKWDEVKTESVVVGQ
jgi:hypothetical protein